MAKCRPTFIYFFYFHLFHMKWYQLKRFREIIYMKAHLRSVYCISYIISSHLICLISFELSALWSDQSEKTARPTSFWLVAATANWVASRRTQFRSSDGIRTKHQMRWNEWEWKTELDEHRLAASYRAKRAIALARSFSRHDLSVFSAHVSPWKMSTFCCDLHQWCCISSLICDQFRFN